MIARIDTTLEQDGVGFPHYADLHTGRWVRTPDGNWTGGFWVGLLWLAAWRTGKSKYRSAAIEWAERLAPRAASKSVFKGFLFWYGAGLGVELFGDRVARQLAYDGTKGLIEMFNGNAGLIPLGTDAEEAAEVGNDRANIDALPGTVALLLTHALQLGADDVARRHLTKHFELCVRSDDSVCQSAVFEPANGRLIRRYTHKGLSDDSTWGRAQAWAMLALGQAMSFGDSSCQETAVAVANWWVAHLPPDSVAYWDFDDPAIPNAPRDSAATAIAAAALLKLAVLVPERRSAYLRTAEASIRALAEHHLTPTGPEDRRATGMLTDGCFDRRSGFATNNELIFGDYFLFEGLLVISGDLAPNRV
ncbi:glycosyl hydrolase [Paraburkholderia sp. 22B1P]